jgi:hypothetical protein
METTWGSQAKYEYNTKKLSLKDSDMNMWIGLFWHRIALCKQSDGLYMSEDPCINRKYSSFLRQWHRQAHRSIPN